MAENILERLKAIEENLEEKRSIAKNDMTIEELFKAIDNRLEKVEEILEKMGFYIPRR